MMQIKVNLSGNLRAILTGKPPEIVAELEGPVTVRQLLDRIGVYPPVVVTVLVNGEAKSKDAVIAEDSVVVLIGPMAGG